MGRFVKHFRAHLGPILGSSISADGYVFATVSDDRDQQQTPSKKGSVKVFDVVNFGNLSAASPFGFRGEALMSSQI